MPPHRTRTGGGGGGATCWGNRRDGFWGGGGGGAHANRQANGKGGSGVVFVEEFAAASGGSATFTTTGIANANSLGENVAVDGTAFGSGSLTGSCSDSAPSNGQVDSITGNHCIKNVNDGKKGDSNSWIPSSTPYGNEKETFVGIRFKSAIKLKGFVISRDATGTYDDRRNGLKQVQVTTTAQPGISTTDWIDVGDAFKINGADVHTFAAQKGIIATGIRVVLTSDATDCIDELEVYGDFVHATEPTASEALEYVADQMDEITKSANALKLVDEVKGMGSMQVFTSAGAGTWKRPQGCTRIRMFVTGGGAGGGSHNSDDAQGGGGAGGTSIKLLDVKSHATVPFVVGKGGKSGTGNCHDCGENGEASTFGTSWNVAGTGGKHVPTWGIGGDGGGASGGEVTLKGGYGQSGNIDGYSNSEGGGNGGDSYWGGGGRGASNWAPNTPGRVGGGGGGNHRNQGESATRGAGGTGIIVVEEYY